MKIRRVLLSDNPLLEKMIKRVFEEFNAPRIGTVYSDPTTSSLYGLFTAPGSILWIAEVEGQIAGCCGVYPTSGLKDDTAELVKFYLAPEFRGRGIGKELMRRSIASAISFGFKKLYLESLPQFAQAIVMYEAFGFQKLDKPLGNSGHVSCDIWMLKHL